MDMFLKEALSALSLQWFMPLDIFAAICQTRQKVGQAYL